MNERILSLVLNGNMEFAIETIVNSPTKKFNILCKIIENKVFFFDVISIRIATFPRPEKNFI